MWQLSGSDGIDQQVLNFINTVTVNLKGAMRAGEVLCTEELMVKASKAQGLQWDDENYFQTSAHQQ